MLALSSAVANKLGYDGVRALSGVLGGFGFVAALLGFVAINLNWDGDVIVFWGASTMFWCLDAMILYAAFDSANASKPLTEKTEEGSAKP